MFKNRNTRGNWFARQQAMGRIHFKDGEGGEGGGSGGDGGDGSDDIQAKIDAAVEAATSGLKAKNQELLDSNKTMKQTLSKVDGVDVEGLLGLKEKIEQDEILSLLAEGKTQEALDRQTEKLRATHEADLNKISTEYEEFKQTVAGKDAVIERLLLTNRIGDEFLNAGGVKEAKDDAIARARGVWKVEGEEIVARDAKGELILGENGPITPKEWAEGLKKSAPHFFPRSTGDLPNGDRGDQSSNEQRLVDAAKKGPEALRAEKARQAAASKK